jgi:hypothetical protein
MRTREEVDRVLTLAAQGLNQSAIARATGIPRGTVGFWLRGHVPKQRSLPHDVRRSLPPEPYAYLLGLYLGDGWIAHFPRTEALRIFFDARYPGLIAECVRSIRRLRPGKRVWVARRVPTQCVLVQSYWTRWTDLFPQHGPGLKHTRPIMLEDWQLEITSRHPEALIRGLIHSDGCRFTNPIRYKDRRYEYARYLFSNRSEDIKAILCAHLELLGIAWRRVGPYNISIARREAVAALDAFVGPKR